MREFPEIRMIQPDMGGGGQIQLELGHGPKKHLHGRLDGPAYSMLRDLVDRHNEAEAKIKELTDELREQNLCHLDPIYEDGDNRKPTIAYRHNFTSHEEDACIWLAKHFPDEFELERGGIRVKR